MHTAVILFHNNNYQSIIYYYDVAAEILLHPKSRLAAIGVEVAFHCKINSSIEPHWVVNNQAALYSYQRDHLAAQGFFFEERCEGGVTMLTMKVNATADKNETKLYCISLPWPGVSSHNATLLIIAGKYLWSNNHF